MLSISTPLSAAQAVSYYDEDNYYQKNEEPGRWIGGEEALSLLGIRTGEAMDSRKWETLIRGLHPDTEEPIVRSAGKQDHRAGIDLTFSAPKSVSLAMELAEANGFTDAGKAIREAHERAVKKAMDEVQNNYIFTRRQNENGKMVKVQSEGMIVAQFQHDTSRVLDPQLHTHNVILNLVEKDGKFTTLSNEELYKNKMYLGQLYRAELAQELQKLGYRIQADHIRGTFEIEGIDRKLMDEFSTMRQAIEEAWREKLPKYKEKYPGKSEAQLKAMIALDARPKKLQVDRDGVRESNRETAERLGYDRERVAALLPDGPAPSLSLPARERAADEALRRAAKVLTAHQSTFTREELLAEAMKHGIGKVGMEEIQERLYRSPAGIRLLDPERGIYSTEEMIRTERSVIERITWQKEMQPVAAAERVGKFLDENYSNMTEGQRGMAEAVLAGTDQFIAIQGDAGTGKTYAAKAIREMADRQGFEVVGLAFTGKAADGLEAESGIRSQTLHSFLSQPPGPVTRGGHRILLIDEAGTMDSRQAAELMELAAENGDKVVFVGDTKQFASIGAGKIFADMQRHGIRTVGMSETLRQTTDHAKEVVEAIKEKDIEAAFSVLEQRDQLREMEKEAAVAAIADRYAQAEAEGKPSPLVVASLNKDKDRLNEAIRDRLGRAGGTPATVMVSRNPTGSAKFYAEGYLPAEGGERKIALAGQIPGFRRGEVLTVAGADPEDPARLLVERADGNRASIDLVVHADKLATHEPQTKEFTEGERIIFTKNIQDKGGFRVKNGERATIEKINDDGSFTVRTDTGREKNFHPGKMPYFDYGYAVTDYKSQGMTSRQVIALADPSHPGFGRQAFYVQATRAKEEIEIYARSVEELKAAAKKEAVKTSTLDFTMKNEMKPKSKQRRTHDKNRSKTKRPLWNSDRESRSDGPHREAEYPDHRTTGAAGRRLGVLRRRRGGRGVSGANRRSEIVRISQTIDPEAVLVAARENPNRFTCHKAPDGSWRIRAGKRSFSTLDFLQKYKKMNFKQAQKTIEEAQKMKTAEIRRKRISPERTHFQER